MADAGVYDVAVVGAGVVGASAAYFAASLGARVALIEQGLPGQEASGRNGGGVRQQGRLPSEVPLAQHAIGLWRHLCDDLGGPFEYVQDGNLFLALNETEAEILRAAALRQQQAGLPVQFLDPPQLRDVSPHLSERILGGNYLASDGVANPILATRFMVRLAKQAGAVLHAGTRVTGITLAGGRAVGLQTDRGPIACGAVLLACGAWAVDLCRPLGLNLAVIARRTQICVTTPLPPVLPQFISGNTVYMRQTMAGNLVLGGGGGWEPLGFRKDTTFHSLHRLVARSTDLVPVVARTSVLRMWAGTLDVSPDGGPLIGPAPGIPGLTVAVGFSGHGFALGPASGQVSARIAMGLEPGVDIAGLSPARFPADFDYSHKAVAEPAP